MNSSFEQKKTIGIIGGLGPYAHIEFERRLLDAAVKITDAKNDQNFPRWILSSIPQTPDRTLAICDGGDSPVPAIVQSIKNIEICYDENGDKIKGADFAVMICNTSYFFLGDIEKQVNIPLLNMIDLTTERIASILPGANVGIFATTGTLKSKIYHDSLSKKGLVPKSPLDLPSGDIIQREMVMESIYGKWNGSKFCGDGIKSGNLEPEHAENFNRTADAMIGAFGIDVFIAGCTEIPIAIPGSSIREKVLIDPMVVTAAAVINIAYELDGEYDDLK
jgi:aspartate racemase